jgi:ankyrin repeat protein
MASDVALQLLTAAERGDNTTMEELLNQSVSPDVQNAYHFTPLILAAYAGSINLILCLRINFLVVVYIAGIKLLVSKGANVNAATLSGNNGLMMAAQNGYLH